jgi:hypothetical protein
MGLQSFEYLPHHEDLDITASDVDQAADDHRTNDSKRGERNGFLTLRDSVGKHLPHNARDYRCTVRSTGTPPNHCAKIYHMRIYATFFKEPAKETHAKG